MNDRRPNILLVTVDSLRADHCGFMGYGKETTPTLDGVAANSVVFENAIAPGPSTPASMPAVFTAQYPVARNEHESLLERRRDQIQTHMETRETIPETLKRRGYTTAAFTPNPFTSRYFGFDQGFDRFEDFMDGSRRGQRYESVFRGFLRGDSSRSLARVLLNLYQREEVFKPWNAYYDEIRAWLDHTGEPYFLWVFLMDAHNPYLAPATYRTQAKWKEFHANYRFWRGSHETPFSDSVHERLVTAYDDAIRYVDEFVAKLFTRLDDRTVLLVHGDHGEAFHEHGTYGHGPSLWEENIHVPLLIHGLSGQTRIETPVSLRRLPEVARRIADGQPITETTSPAVFSQTFDGKKRLLRGRSWRYLDDGEDRTLEHLATDESRSVSSREPDTDVLVGYLAGVVEAQRERERIVEGTEHLWSTDRV